MEKVNVHSVLLRELLLKGKKHVFKKGMPINISNDGVYLTYIETGYVKRFQITSDGTESVQAIFGSNEIFPLNTVLKSLFNFGINPHKSIINYEAITQVVIYSVTEEEFLNEAEKTPLIYKDLLYVAAMRLRSNINRLESTSMRVANRKVMHRLLFLCERFGKETNIGIKIELPLTHQLLADCLSLARETVTLSIDRLKEKGLIETEGKFIIVPDVEKMLKELH